MDLSQRIVETIVVNLAEQRVPVEVLADVLRTSPMRAILMCSGDEAWRRIDVERACEYLEIDLAAALHVPTSDATD